MTAMVSYAAVTAVLAWALLFGLLRSGLALRIAVDTPNRRSLHSGVVPRIGGLVVAGVALARHVDHRSQPSSDHRDCSRIDAAICRRRSPRAECAYETCCAADRRRDRRLHVAARSTLVVHGTDHRSHRMVDESLQLHGRLRRSGGRHDVFRLRSIRIRGGKRRRCGDWQRLAAVSQARPPDFCCTIFRLRKYSWATPDQYHLASSQQVLGITGWQQQVWPLWFPVLAFSPFIIDATVTLVRRAVAGKKVWEAHNEHLYQRMVTNGWGHARTAIAWYAVMALAAGSAIAAVSWPIAWQITLLLGWLALYAVLYASIGRLIRTPADEA